MDFRTWGPELPNFPTVPRWKARILVWSLAYSARSRCPSRSGVSSRAGPNHAVRDLGLVSCVLSLDLSAAAPGLSRPRIPSTPFPLPPPPTPQDTLPSAPAKHTVWKPQRQFFASPKGAISDTTTQAREDSSPGDWPATCGPGHPDQSRGALHERGRSCQGQGQRRRRRRWPPEIAAPPRSGSGPR